MNRDVLRFGSCSVCGSRRRLSDIGVCLSCHARTCAAAAESLQEWVRFLQHGLEHEEEQPSPGAEAVRGSLVSLSRPLSELCQQLEASALRESVGTGEAAEGWCW
jgi:hypothetical protein